jgi:outer membrane immunogenic protein
MKRVAWAAIGLAAASTMALGSDLPVPASIHKSTLSVPTYDWTGPHVGLSLGGHWGNAEFTTISIGGAPPPFSPTSRQVELSAVRVGGYLGYDWQVFRSWVVGVEADLAWANASRTVPGVVGGTPAPVAGDSTTSEMSWDGSLRGRAGFLITPTWLLYGTAGVAWQRIEATTICSAATCGALGGTQTDSRVLTGWTAGGGIEGAVYRNWLLRAEYRYADYPKWRHTYFSGFATSVNDSKVRTQTGLIGIAYRF